MKFDLVIQNVALIPMPGNRLIPDMDIAVSGNSISSIRKHSKNIQAANTVDGTGKFLIPGLFDMHVHCHNDSLYPLFLANGVTAIRDVGSDQEDIYERKREVNSGKVLGPRMYIAGPILEGDPPLWEGFRVIKTKSEARKTVRELKKSGVDFIKVYHTLQKDLLVAVLAEAKKQELQVTGHISNEVSIAEALELGQTGIEHISDIAVRVGKIKSKKATSSEYDGWRIFTDLAINQAKLKVLQAALKKHSGYICPTLIVGEQVSKLSDYENLRKSPEARYMPSSVVNTSWNPSHPESAVNIRNLKPLYFDNYRVIHETSKELVLPLSESATILAGSDTPNPFVIPGFSLPQELELLVKSGLMPYRALEAATYNGATYLNALNELGTIERNKIANMVLLRENPLTNISAVQNIEGVILNGNYLPDEELQRNLDKVG